MSKRTFRMFSFCERSCDTIAMQISVFISCDIVRGMKGEGDQNQEKD